MDDEKTMDETRGGEDILAALYDLREEFDGAAEEAGLVDEDDVVRIIRKCRERRTREHQQPSLC